MNLNLYVNGKRVDLGDDFQISLNYSFTELQQPTTVKNSFTKTVTLLGTKNNNLIFDNYIDTRHNIIQFDPTLRIPFSLYLGTDLFQSGYLKLDSVTRTNDIFRYHVTLYGGLGEFFYTLSSSTLEELSLYFMTDISINKETVFDDWNSYPQKDIDICWIPEYSGIYDDFDNSKIQYSQDSTEDLPEELDEYQVGDFRSYMQRPAVYAGSIVEGICAQSGFDVSIDDSFAQRSNPYWENLVVTFPKLDMSEKGQRWLENSYNIDSSMTKALSHIGIVPINDSSFYLEWSGTTGRDFSSYKAIQPILDTQMQVFIPANDVDEDAILVKLSVGFYNSTTDTWTKTKDTLVFASENLGYSAGEHEIVMEIHELVTYDANWKYARFYDASTHTYVGVINKKLEFDPIISYSITNDKFGFYAPNFFWTGTNYIKLSLSNNVFTNRYANPENLHSNRRLTFADIANNKIKQSDFLLSYTKAFGMLYRKDKNSKHIDILTRNTFFNNYRILDWSSKLDLSKELTINPLTFDSHYYSFKFQDAQSSYLDAYYKEIGEIYGEQIINTDYQINNDKKELLQDSVFTQPLTTTEYLWRMNFIPSIDGISYSAKTVYDSTPRPSNFSWDGHTRKPENNSMQLYFRLPATSVDYPIWISDDTPIQVFKQEFNYVYPTVELGALYTKSVTSLPVYSDYISAGVSGFSENFSLQFKNPVKTYNGLSYNDSSATIYSRFWEKYLNDLYDKNNKVVTCYFNLSQADMLNFDFKDFVFVDGVIYHVNNIFDYNPLSEQSTKVELVQVRDIDAYINGQRYAAIISYYLRASRTSGTFDANGGSFNPVLTTNSPTGIYVVSNTNPSMLSYNSSNRIISVSSNSGTTDRSASITFGIQEDSTQRVTVTITQTARQIEYYLSPSLDSASITWPAQTAYSNFSTNGTIVKVSGDSWLTVSNNTIQAAENGNYFSQEIYSAPRTGTITVALQEDNTKTAQINVSQNANYFVRTHYSPGTNSYTYTINDTGPRMWDPSLFSNGTITYEGSDVNWIEYYAPHLEIDANSSGVQRVGVATFSVNEGTEQLEITVNQAGSEYYINPSSTTQTITKDAQNVFQFSTNGTLIKDMNYSATDASWLNIETNISGNTFVTATENGMDTTITPPFSTQRTGTLHVTLSEDTAVHAIITVTQNPTYYCRTALNNYSGASYTYSTSNAAGVLDPDVETNGTLQYFVQNDASTWLSYNSTTGEINFTENTTGNSRTGYVGFYISESEDDFLIYVTQEPNSLTFTNLDDANDTSIRFTRTYSAPSINLDYSYDGANWQVVTLASTIELLLPAGGVLKVKGPNNSTFSNSSGQWRISSTDTDFSVSGNLAALLSSSVTELPSHCFSEMFYNSTHLVDASALTIPWSAVSEHSFSRAFNGCSSLTSAPALPATTLAASCYANMFNGCSSLRRAPRLNATTLATSCYYGMFKGCTSLRGSVVMRATTLAESCCERMFYGCSSLTSTPDLYATTPAAYCYRNMFYNCSSLYQATVYLTSRTGVSEPTSLWLTNVAANGTLFCPYASRTLWTTAPDGKPASWTVETL